MTARKPPYARSRIEEIQDMHSPFGDEDESELTATQAELQQVARCSLMANGHIRAWRNAVETGELDPQSNAADRRLADADELLREALAALDRARTLPHDPAA